MSDLIGQLRLPVSESMFVRKTDMMRALFQEREEAANALSSKDAEIEALRTRAESAEALLAEALTFDQKTAINSRFEVLFEEGTRTGKHGFYETVFEAMHTAYGEFLRARSTLSKIGDRT